MKHSIQYLLLAMTAIAFTVPGCGGQAVKVPSPDSDTGELKAGPTERGKTAAEKSKPKNGTSAGGAKAEMGSNGFTYGDDEAGKMLADRLTPHRIAPPAPAGHATGPKAPPRRAPEAGVEVPIPANVARPPQPRTEPPPPLRPKSAPAEVPYEWDRSDPDVPARIVLPEQGKAPMGTGSGAPKK
jgi:hypothetical protein